MTVYTINERFQDVDWSAYPTPDRAFTDIPFEVYDQSGFNDPYNGQRGDIEEYDDPEFPLDELLRTQHRALADDGIGLVCHSKHQQEPLVSTARATDGLHADYPHAISLYFTQDGSGGETTPPLYTKRKLANARYTVSVVEQPEHEFDHEYVLDAQPYPRKRRDVDWHPCPFDQDVLRSLMEQFGGECWVDFAAGTGTTGLAAKDLGVDAILVEVDETYYEQMTDRVAGYSPRRTQPADQW